MQSRDTVPLKVAEVQNTKKFQSKTAKLGNILTFAN